MLFFLSLVYSNKCASHTFGSIFIQHVHLYAYTFAHLDINDHKKMFPIDINNNKFFSAPTNNHPNTHTNIVPASGMLQYSGMSSIYYGLWKNLFARWTGSATEKITRWHWTTSSSSSSQTNSMATNPHECAVYCINLMSSKLRLKRHTQSLSYIIVSVLILFRCESNNQSAWWFRVFPLAFD